MRENISPSLTNEEEYKMKTCVRCNKELPKTEFHKNKQVSDGLHPYCKTCRKNAYKRYSKTERGKEAINRASRNYQSKKRLLKKA